MLRFSIVGTDEAYREAQLFIHAIYSRQGYVDQGADPHGGIRSYIGKEGVHTIVAHIDDLLVGTISLVEGLRNKLPMEDIYEKELENISLTRKEICEISQFAVDDTRITQILAKTGEGNIKFDVTVGLLGHVIALAKRKDILHCCFTINPKHRLFYESFGCVQIGNEKPYALVKGAPALAYMLDLGEFEKTDSRQNFIAQKITQMQIEEVFFSESVHEKGPA